MPLRLRPGLALAPVFIALLSGSACVDIVGADLRQHVESEEKRFATSGTPDVDLTTFDGAIEIRPWDRSEVLVVIEKRGFDKTAIDAMEVTSEHDGGRIMVGVRLPAGSRNWNLSWGRHSPSAKLIASVPASANVTARTGDGSIDVERITGTLDLHSGDGGIRAREVQGHLRASTGDGSIRLEEVDGSLDVDTGDGAIAASGTLTAVRARTGYGSVTIRAAPGSTAVTDWRITSGDGSVTLELPDGFGGELDARTGAGGIRMGDVSVSNVTRDRDRNAARGTLGSGGRTVQVRTGDGSITLRRF